MTSEFQRMLDDLLRKYIHEEFMKAVDEDLEPRPGWQGFTGLKPIADELQLFDHNYGFVPSWTPKQFETMWNSFSYVTKIRYVRSLLTENRTIEYSSADVRLSTLLYR